jgi:hypothetical protein
VNHLVKSTLKNVARNYGIHVRYMLRLLNKGPDYEVVLPNATYSPWNDKAQIGYVLDIEFKPPPMAARVSPTRLTPEHETGEMNSVSGQVSRPAFVSGWRCERLLCPGPYGEAARSAMRMADRGQRPNPRLSCIKEVLSA